MDKTCSSSILKAKHKNMKNQKISKTILAVLLASSLLACNGNKNETKNSDGSGIASMITALSLNDVMLNDRCLSVQRYGEALRALAAQTSILEVTTEFSIPSTFRQDFRSLATYGAFQFERVTPDQISDFDGFQQEDCETLSFSMGDGDMEVFKIASASQDKLTAKAVSGREIEFHWLSPHSIEIKNRYQIFDAPCTSKSGFAEYTKILDWSSDSDPASLEVDSKLSIDKEFLATVARSVGHDVDGLYNSDGSLIVNKLKDLMNQPVRPELLSCDGIPDPGSPDPGDEADPDHHPESGSTPPATGGSGT